MTAVSASGTSPAQALPLFPPSPWPPLRRLPPHPRRAQSRPPARSPFSLSNPGRDLPPRGHPWPRVDSHPRRMLAGAVAGMLRLQQKVMAPVRSGAAVLGRPVWAVGLSLTCLAFFCEQESQFKGVQLTTLATRTSQCFWRRGRGRREREAP